MLVPKVMEVANHDSVMQSFQEEDPRHAKATQADDVVVQVEVWNQRVAEQLTQHWTSTRTQPHFEPTLVKALKVMRNGLL